MGLIENKTLTPYYDVLEPKGKFWLKRTGSKTTESKLQHCTANHGNFMPLKKSGTLIRSHLFQSHTG